MDSSPIISVIIPVYNVASCLPRCLDSVLSQTYRNIEVIVVDDGSTDESGAILDAYARRDARMQVIHQVNRGLSGARNAGLRAMRGALASFVDADDWVEPEFLAVLERALRERDADISQVAHVVDMPGSSLVRHIDEGVFDALGAIERLERGRLYGYMAVCLYRRELWEGVAFPADRLPCEDARTMWRLFVRARRIAGVDLSCYHYVKREGSITASPMMRMEVFSSRLDRYRECVRLEREGGIFKGASAVFFEPLAAAAWEAGYLATPEERGHRGLGAEARTFWRAHCREIARLGRGYWGGWYLPKVVAPRLTARCARLYAAIVRIMPAPVRQRLKLLLGGR